MQKVKKKYGGVMALWAMLLALALSLSYAPEVSAAAKSSNVKGITVKNLPAKTLTLKKGKSMTLKVKVESTNKKKVSQKVTYKSNNTKVASVSSKGKIKAKKKGKATITITSKANTKKSTKITVRVGTPVTSVSLNKTSATLQTGQSITLKASVKPKKPTNKNIIWSSSNSAVAKVNSKGKVTALKAGTVKITAMAEDGSGKKKSATINVKDPVVVKEVAVVNAATVKVTLSEAADLTKDSFAVKSNRYGGSTYNKVNKVDNISTTDKTAYLVVLDSRSRFKDRDHVQVTVTGLWGTPSSVSTAIFNDGTFKYTDEITWEETVGERTERGFGSSIGIGYKAYSVTNLPKGILYEEADNQIRFYGKPQQAGDVVTEVVVADEAGNTYTYAITWVIRGKDGMSVTVSGTKYYLLNAEGRAVIGEKYEWGGSHSNLYVSVNGGSGDYKYSLTGNAYGLEIGETSGYITGELRARGDYPLNIRVQDNENPAKVATRTVTIHVEQSVTISGIVKDLGGNPIPHRGYVKFINKDKANKFADSDSDWTYTDDKGAFSITLVSGTYDIEASCEAGSGDTTSYLYAQGLTTTRSGFDLTLQVRKITVISGNSAVIKADALGEWEDQYGEVYGSGEYLYLKDGTSVALTASADRRDATITATVTANASVPTATANITVTSKNIPAITENTPISNISLPDYYDDDYAYYKFVPKASGTYYFYSTNGTGYTRGNLQGGDTEYGTLTSAYGGSLLGTENDFCFSWDCTAGKTYYVGIAGYSGEKATLNVSVNDPNANYQPPADEEEVQTYNGPAVEDEAEKIKDDADVTPEDAADDMNALTEETMPAEESSDSADAIEEESSDETDTIEEEAADETSVAAEETADETDAVAEETADETGAVAEEAADETDAVANGESNR